MSVEDVVTLDEVQEVKQYVCLVKARVGEPFALYKRKVSGEVVVQSLREFLDHEISHFRSPEVFAKLLLKDFVEDVATDVANSRLVTFFGWNYPEAVRIVESEGLVYAMIIHPKFQAIPYSFRRVKEEDDYALALVKKLWSLRGGDIVFEEYDPEKHVPECEPNV